MKNFTQPLTPWEKVRRVAIGFVTSGVVLLVLFIFEGKFLPEEGQGVLWTAVLCFLVASVLFLVSARKKHSNVINFF